MSFPHRPDLREKARDLRKGATPWENKLWYEFLSRYPVRFQRQKPIGTYIVDFCCAKAKLVIELDGGQHYEEAGRSKDQQRTRELEVYGLQILRICNSDITKKLSRRVPVHRRDRKTKDRGSNTWTLKNPA